MAQTKEGVKKIRRKYGKDAYKNWGKLGGSPAIRWMAMLKAIDKIDGKEVASVSDKDN